jgi:hypothetical protein
VIREETAAMRQTLMVALLAIAVSTAYGVAKIQRPLDDDRPPIIVTNGSMYFEDGNPNDTDNSKWKNWTKANRDNNAKQWTQEAPNGFDVKSFTVTITGSSDPKCNSKTTSVAAIAIEYTPDSGAKSLVVVQRVPWSSGGGNVKSEPWVIAPSDMVTMSPSGRPPGLVYGDPGKGYVSFLTLSGSFDTLPCHFPKQKTTNITIQPMRTQ